MGMTHTHALPLLLVLVWAACGDTTPAPPVDTTDTVADAAMTEDAPSGLLDTSPAPSDLPPVEDAERSRDATTPSEVIAPEDRAPCDPIDDEGCATTETCTWASADATRATCEPAGPSAPGETCSDNVGCAAGVCLSVNGAPSACHSLCDTALDCPNEAPCLTVEDLPFTVCERWDVYTTCLLSDPATCPEDRGCYLVGEQPDPLCLLPGDGSAGSPCEVANACDAGLACVNTQCRALCDPAAESACESPEQTCTPYYQGAGVCLDPTG